MATRTAVRIDLGDWVARRARTHGEIVALQCSGETLTYGALDRRVEGATRALREQGVDPGEPVGVLMGNGVEVAILAHAVPRAGGLFMPLNVRLTPEEIAWQLRDSGARRMLHDAEHAALARAAGAAAGVEVLDGAGSRWRADAGPGDAEAVIPGDRPHSVIYTSGTTGRPKGAVLTHGNFYWSAVASAANIGVPPAGGDRWLACMPLFHVGGLSILLRSPIYGTTAVIHERFDEVAANRALREEGVTLASVVATMLQRMFALDDGGYPESVRAVLLGGGPAPLALLEEAQRRGLPVLQTYGLTETASQVATLAPADALRKLGSAGLPLLASSVRVEVDGRVAQPGEVGEIVVSGPTVCAGYLHQEAATAAAVRDGWLYTGDLGYLDDEGYLYVADRRDDLIVTGGENVYPAEVEAALLAHEAVEECAVVGLPDDRWGAQVAAVVVPSEGTDVEALAGALEEHLRSRLAGYKVPRSIAIWREALPRTASGKLQRHLVRERLLSE